MSSVQCTLRQLQGDAIPAARSLLTPHERFLLQSRDTVGVGAFLSGAAVGVMLLVRQGPALFVSRLYIAVSYRRRGLGTRLLEAAQALARKSRLMLTVPFLAAGLDDPVYRLLVSTHSFAIRPTGGCRARCPLREWDQVCPPPVLYFAQPRLVRMDFQAQLECRQPLLARDLQRNARAYRQDLSCCSVQDNKIKAACLIKEERERLLLHILTGLPGEGMRTAAATLAALGLVRDSGAEELWVQTADQDQAQVLDRLRVPYEVTGRYYMAYAKDTGS